MANPKDRFFRDMLIYFTCAIDSFCGELVTVAESVFSSCTSFSWLASLTVPMAESEVLNPVSDAGATLLIGTQESDLDPAGVSVMIIESCHEKTSIMRYTIQVHYTKFLRLGLYTVHNVSLNRLSFSAFMS